MRRKYEPMAARATCAQDLRFIIGELIGEPQQTRFTFIEFNLPLIEFIAEDEYVEITPGGLRIRKAELSMSRRDQARKRHERETASV